MSLAENNDMTEIARKSGINNPGRVYYNATPEQLIEETILRDQGLLSQDEFDAKKRELLSRV